MAKKDPGYYSAEAIQQRQTLVRDEFYREKAKQDKATQEQPQQTQPTAQPIPQPSTDTGVFTPTPMDGEQTWDYKTAQTDLNGNPLEQRNVFGFNLQPKGFDPSGEAYFGGGFSGWAKKWLYKFGEEAATADESQQAWKSFWETSSQFSQNVTKPLDKNATSEEKTQRAQEQGGLFLQGAQELFSAIGKSAESSEASSVLTPIIRGVNAAVGMTLEGFQWISEVPEKAMGAQRAMREYTPPGGVPINTELFDAEEMDATFEQNKPIYVKNADERIGLRTEAIEVAVRSFNPILASIDSFKFWTAPGSFKEKTEVIKQGWTEGTMLYSELYKPMIREEYKARVLAGEDPELLVRELQDPWVEAVGEIIFDPLNFVGAFGKAAKVGETVLEASQATARSGLLNDLDFIENLKALSKTAGDTDAVKITSKIETKIMEAASDAGRRIDAAQNWKKATALDAAGNQFRQTRNVSNYLNNVVQGIRNSGGTPDDVMDYVSALIKRASGDSNFVRDSIATISHSPLQTLAYNQQAFDTGYMLKRLMGEGDELVKALKNTTGNWDDLRKVLDDKMKKAIEFSFPDIVDMQKAADKAAELAKTGQAVDAKTANLAERYAELAKTQPGVVAWSKTQAFVKSAIKPINGFLANSYFSLSYGYAFRNLMQNMVTLWADDGLEFGKDFALQFTKSGIQTPRLDDALIKSIGYIPESLKGKTLTQTVTEDSLAKKFFGKLNSWGYSPAALADAAEVYAGKMIYLKKYRSTMESVMKPGALLPDMQTWTKAGFSPAQMDDFADILRASNYNEAEAVTAFTKKFGEGTVDKWRMLDWVNPDVKKGLMEYDDMWNDIVRLTQRDDVSQQQVLDAIDEMKVKVRRNANKAASEPARINDADPLWKEISNANENAGKFRNVAEDNQMLSLKTAFDRAAAEYNDALNDVAKKLKGNLDAEPTIAKIQDFTSNVNRQALNEAASARVAEKNAWAWDVTKKVKSGNPPESLWDEAILGTRPPKVDRDTLLNAVWEHYRVERKSTWGGYFEKYTKEARALAQETGMQDLFGKAEKSLIELQQYRDYVYTDKGIFTQVPKIKPAQVGSAENASNIRKIANTYGIPTASAGGAPNDKQILNIINKYAPPPKVDAMAATEGEIVKKINLAADEWVDVDGTVRKKVVFTTELDQEARAAQAKELRESESFQSIKERAAALREQRKAAAKVETPKVETPKVEPVNIEPVAPTKYTRLEDVPPTEAERAIAEHMGHKQKGFFKKEGEQFVPKPVSEGVPVAPPRDPNVSPAGHVFTETKQGTLDALEHIRKGIKERWGLRTSAGSDADALKALTSDITDKLSVARSQSQMVAEKFRDFALLPYGETKNMDFAMSLVYPYQFWYTRSYKNWMQRAFMTNPEIISRYANLKEGLSQQQKDLPDWWKSQVDVSGALNMIGIETENPIYINLEATLFPLYGLTGTDFNDPTKRTNWFTSTLDDMGKMGPSVWAPYQWAVAAYYYGKGEKEIASKWGGRMIPQTATIKSVSSYFGTPLELDPAVQLFSGDGLLDFRASDSYEEARIARALSSMENEGYTQEQLLEAMRTQKGDIWNEAYRRAVQERAPGQISSFFFGVGFKGRSQNDVEIDRFYGDYFRLKNLRDGNFVTPEQYQNSMNSLRERYPFMDIILLSRRSGDGRDAAYAYNVMSRIPPGLNSQILELAGVDPETAQKFYDSGGKLDHLSETERQRFLASMVDIGAILAIPKNSTRREWTAARQNYSDLNEQLQLALGDDILDKIDSYYAIDDKNQARAYMQQHPEIQQAMELKNQLVVEDPLLMKYYGGVDVLERYYSNQMFDTLEKEFGEDIRDLEQQYYSLDPKERKKFKQQNPELNDYFDRKKELKDDIVRQMVRFGEIIDPRPEARDDAEPNNPIQEDLFNSTQPAPQFTAEEWRGMLGESLVDVILEYGSGGRLSSYARNELEYQAQQFGVDPDELLRQVLLSQNVVQSP